MGGQWVVSDNYSLLEGESASEASWWGGELGSQPPIRRLRRLTSAQGVGLRDRADDRWLLLDYSPLEGESASKASWWGGRLRTPPIPFVALLLTDSPTRGDQRSPPPLGGAD